MADLITVEDPDDPRLRDYTGLTDVELRRKREPAEGLFIAEGEKVIRRAKEAGYEMRSMLLSAKWVDVMRDVIDELPAPVYAVSPELAEQVTGYHVHRGALASMQRKPLPTAADLLRSARRVVVMESVNDHTNIGAIFRSAAALGMDAVLLSPDCADPLYRRSVKVSMGAVFSVPYARLDTWPKSLESVREAGFTLTGLVAFHHGSAEHWTRATRRLLSDWPLTDGGPCEIVFSCARENSFKHPHPECYEPLFTAKHMQATADARDAGKAAIDLLFRRP